MILLSIEFCDFISPFCHISIVSKFVKNTPRSAMLSTLASWCFEMCRSNTVFRVSYIPWSTFQQTIAQAIFPLETIYSFYQCLYIIVCCLIDRCHWNWLLLFSPFYRWSLQCCFWACGCYQSSLATHEGMNSFLYDNIWTIPVNAFVSVRQLK